MKIETNTLISHYKIVCPIGKGGMGEVYLAQDTKLNRKVAIKFLNKEFGNDADKLNRFVQEAQAASALNQPNIITIYEIGEFEKAHYIATEYIEGETLTHKFKNKSQSIKFVLETSIQIASALDAAHNAGIVHRDIKPDNIIVRPDGLVKILDFGIAKLTEKQSPDIESEDATAIQVNTTPGMIIGTANYMSPEQAKGQEVDARTDIFSFGVVLYEMIAGHLPFEGETPMEIIAAIINKEPKPLDSNVVPPEIERIISKSLRKDRNERYQTIRGLLADLKELKQELEFQDKLEKTVSPDKNEPETQMFKATTVVESSQTTNEDRNDSITIKKSGIGKAAIGVFALLLVSAIGFGYWFYSGNSSKQIGSIAVMPFVNESGNEDLEYLSDGMTETLIGSLSMLPNMNVKARSSVFRYKGKNTDAKTIGKELSVQAVLNGRIIQRGEQLTLNLELVDAQTENVIWSDKYQRKTSDLLALQSEIAKDVSTKLKSKLSGAEEAKVTKTATVDPEAYQAYLKGRYFWNRRTAEDLKKAIEQFKAATDRDPNYALAYAGLADCYVILNQYAGVPTSETIPKVKDYAERAISLDDQLAGPHASLAQIHKKLWQWADAEREFKRAIELDPKYSTAYHWYSLLLKDLGRFDESALMIRRAQEIDPLSSIISLNISEMYQAQNNHNASVENSLKLIELDPNFGDAYNILGTSYLKLGRNEEALTNFEKAAKLLGRASFSLYQLGYGYAAAGKRTEAYAVAMELEERYSRRETSGKYVAAVYAGLGDKDRAFEWLEKDFRNKDELGELRWSVQLEPLRSDPRMAELMKRMGLPELK
jgi:serine/threonine-protein kinase